jgi:hypothetical protein
MHMAIKMWMAVAVAAAMSLMAGAGTASAATAGVQLRFAAQARAAGISNTQADYLQQEVINYIHKHGGTQAALNVVDVPGGSITFVVPGEKYARDLATDPHVLAAATCPPEYFCAYEYGFYTGTERSYFDNCKSNTMPWATEGSYINDLSGQGWAVWYGVNGNVVYTTPPAFNENQEVNWTPVYYIEACYVIL